MSTHVPRKAARLTALLTLLMAGGWTLAQSAASMKVFKSPTCGCCRKWVDHLRAAGFSVVTEDVPDTAPVRARYGVPDRLSSCHTGLVEGYVVEGHVPADLIHKMLKEKPRVVGIAVPGMPMGSPGMEGPTPQRYDIVTFDGKGNSRVYASR